MPKRFLKPGLTTSEHWNACSFEAQSFYVRLITLVDDYGRYDGRPLVLKAHAFPLTEKLTTQRIEELCFELSKNELASFYVSNDVKVVQLLRWEEKPRSEPKFPANDSNCVQLFADDSNCSPRARVRPSSSSSSSSSSSPLSATALEIYAEYPKKVNKEDAITAILKALKKVDALKLREQTALFAKCVKGCDAQFIPYPASWFNAGGYDSDPEEWSRIGRKNGHHSAEQTMIPGTYNP